MGLPQSLQKLQASFDVRESDRFSRKYARESSSSFLLIPFRYPDLFGLSLIVRLITAPTSVDLNFRADLTDETQSAAIVQHQDHCVVLQVSYRKTALLK